MRGRSAPGRQEWLAAWPGGQGTLGGSHMSSSKRGTGGLRAAVLAVAAVAVVSLGLGACDGNAVRVDKSKPILFVHGYNLTSTSTDCGSTFDTMIASLRSQGFTGPMIRVGYYSGDTNCDVNLHSYGSYGDRDSWKNIAHAMATYVYGTYTSKATTVDMVGY